MAALGWLLNWGTPQVAVAIALDFSPSTSGFVREQEIQAVNSYLEQNQELRNPNQIKIFGFATKVESLTSSFEADSEKVKNELAQSRQNPTLENRLGGGTEIDLAIQEATKALSVVDEERCRELLIVSDGQDNFGDEVINNAIANKVKINAVILGGQNSSAVERATTKTNGIYLQDEASNLETLFANRLFARFNSNIRWVMFWLGGAFIFLMWMLTLPLDRWLFQGLIGLNMTLGGQLALANALFWSVLTIIIVSQLWGLPFGASC